MDLRGVLVLGMPCAASMPTSKPGRPRNLGAKAPLSHVRPGHCLFKPAGRVSLQFLDRYERGAESVRAALRERQIALGVGAFVGGGARRLDGRELDIACRARARLDDREWPGRLERQLR